MKGSMRWKPGPLVEVSNAPPLREEREGRERRPAQGRPGRGEAAGPASPVIDADVPLLDLVDGREEGGGEEAEGERRDGAQLGHARCSAAALPGGPARSAAPARPGAALTSSQRDRPRRRGGSCPPPGGAGSAGNAGCAGNRRGVRGKQTRGARVRDPPPPAPLAPALPVRAPRRAAGRGAGVRRPRRRCGALAAGALCAALTCGSAWDPPRPRGVPRSTDTPPVPARTAAADGG